MVTSILYKENDDIIINLTLTPRCNARCKDSITGSLTFAGDVAVDPSSQECDPGRDVALVLKIAEKHRIRRQQLYDRGAFITRRKDVVR